MPNPRLLAVLVSVLILSGTLADAQTSLRPHNSATQLLVDGKPFLMLGVETTNKLLDDPSDLPHLDENLAVYKAACVNTVLIPVTRKTFEPVEDQYDTTMIDALIAGCRPHDHELVVLWFGAIRMARGASRRDGSSMIASDSTARSSRMEPRASVFRRSARRQSRPPAKRSCS
jgi:hypothetical protein